MIINASNLATVFTSFNGAFRKGFASAAGLYKPVSMVVPSSTGTEEYGWLGQFPGLREWIGPRHVNNLTAHRYAIANRLFESTIGVPRTAIEDDHYGLFAPVFTELGLTAAEHPDALVFSLLKSGFTANCYDNQFFFDTDHPVGDTGGIVSTVSNMQAGSSDAWYLLDTSRAIKPLIFQERVAYDLQALDKSTDEPVFKNDEYLYGVRARSNAGYGLWQLAFGSKATLDATNYAAARVAMMNLTGDGGRPLNIKPDMLVVPPGLEGAALRLLNSEYGTGGVTNEWKGTAKIVVTPLVA